MKSLLHILYYCLTEIVTTPKQYGNDCILYNKDSGVGYLYTRTYFTKRIAYLDEIPKTLHIMYGIIHLYTFTQITSQCTYFGSCSFSQHTNIVNVYNANNLLNVIFL